MRYTETHLIHGETLVCRAGIHLIVFCQPLVLIALGYLCYADDGAANRVPGVVLLSLGLWSPVQRLMIKLGADYSVITHRLVLKTGIAARRVRELMHHKIESVAVVQDIPGRILGYGSIIVSTGGVVNTYAYISDPLRFRSTINQCMENSRLRHNTNL